MPRPDMHRQTVRSREVCMLVLGVCRVDDADWQSVMPEQSDIERATMITRLECRSQSIAQEGDETDALRCQWDRQEIAEGMTTGLAFDSHDAFVVRHATETRRRDTCEHRSVDRDVSVEYPLFERMASTHKRFDPSAAR